MPGNQVVSKAAGVNVVKMPGSRQTAEEFLLQRLEEVRTDPEPCKELVVVRLIDAGKSGETVQIDSLGTNASTLWALVRAQNALLDPEA